MTLQEEVDLLRNIPLFSKIETSKLKLIAFTSERKLFSAGTVICREGEDGEAAFVIVKGHADVTVKTPRGDIKVNDCHPNDIIGEIAVLCDVPRTATVMARTDVTALVISRELFLRLIQEFPSIGLELMRELGMKLAQTTRRLRDGGGETGNEQG